MKDSTLFIVLWIITSFASAYIIFSLEDKKVVLDRKLVVYKEYVECTKGMVGWKHKTFHPLSSNWVIELRNRYLNECIEKLEGSNVRN